MTLAALEAAIGSPRPSPGASRPCHVGTLLGWEGEIEADAELVAILPAGEGGDEDGIGPAARLRTNLLHRSVPTMN